MCSRFFVSLFNFCCLRETYLKLVTYSYNDIGNAIQKIAPINKPKTVSSFATLPIIE